MEDSRRQCKREMLYQKWTKNVFNPIQVSHCLREMLNGKDYYYCTYVHTTWNATGSSLLYETSLNVQVPASSVMADPYLRTWPDGATCRVAGCFS